MDNARHSYSRMVDIKGDLVLENIMKLIIDELGATGVLVCGLYFILHRPMNKIAHHMEVINGEIGQVVQCLNDLKSKGGK